MKVYRGPRSGGRWSLTDSKKPQELAQAWAPGRKIVLDGTIEKDGERHTDFGIEIEEGDVVALFNALVKQYSSDLKKSQKEVEMLEGSMDKIYDLVTFHSEEAPSQEALTEAVATILFHYRMQKAQD